MNRFYNLLRLWAGRSEHCGAMATVDNVQALINTLDGAITPATGNNTQLGLSESVFMLSCVSFCTADDLADAPVLFPSSGTHLSW